MPDALVDELRTGVAGAVVGDAALDGLTTLRVGGRARALVTAERDEDLAHVGRVAAARGVPVVTVGRGSNSLVPDEGWAGVVVVLGRAYEGVEVDLGGDGGTVVVGGAEPLPRLSKRLADAGLAGFAWGAGVPGSLGGAVRMNAGAHGGDMADVLVEVDLFRFGSGTRETWPAAALQLGYRSSTLPSDAVVVAATLRLPAGDADAEHAERRRVLAWRREHQPLSEPNCGSVFTNPPGDSAGRLIEAAGCKGLEVGGARVSEKHANFVVTRPGATAADVLGVVEAVRRRVRETHGVDLHPEVTVVGR